MSKLLSDGLLAWAQRDPDAVALDVDGQTVTYGELLGRAEAIAALAQEYDRGGPPLTAVYGHRSVTAFAGVIAALRRGHGYVPLNCTFPVGRTSKMLGRSGCRTVIVDQRSVDQLAAALAEADTPLLIIAPDLEDVSSLRRLLAGHEVLGAGDLEGVATPAPVDVSPDAIAYLLFTSGSTGDPKGVMVTHRNATSFVDWAVAHYGVDGDDRCSQTFDLTFDLSVFDMFVAWSAGARLCCPSTKALLNPGRFIRDRELTLWFSVPSLGVFMRRLGALKPQRYPSLRWSLFCGEALPVDVVNAWREAAPNSVIENLYGPTEATIACTYHRWDPGSSPAASVHGVVPIGEAIGEMKAVVMGPDLAEVPTGQEGELLVAGPQVARGYWRDPEKTAAVFVVPPGLDEVHYRTGDRVKRQAEGKPLVYLGRMDHQLQVLGHRVELGEIEAVLRRESGQDAVIALGWPITVSGAGGIVAFIVGTDLEEGEILRRAAQHLPDYMVPRRLYLRDELPLNANGKYDRRALLQELEDMA